jgi:hypothetical protein
MEDETSDKTETESLEPRVMVLKRQRRGKKNRCFEDRPLFFPPIFPAALSARGGSTSDETRVGRRATRRLSAVARFQRALADDRGRLCLFI